MVFVVEVIPDRIFTEDFETDFTQKICVCLSFCFRRQLRVVKRQVFSIIFMYLMTKQYCDMSMKNLMN